jgi:hypothetical protein
MLRYQLPRDLHPTQVAQAVADTASFWRQQRGKLAYRDVIGRLETDHHELLPYLTGPPGQLRQKIEESQHRQADRSQKLEAELRGFAEPTGMVSPAMVDQIATLGHDRADVLTVAAPLGSARTVTIFPAAAERRQ